MAQPSSPNILIVKLSAVGDVVHALPVLDTLRHVYPDARITWAVHPGARGILEGHPQLNGIITIPRKVKKPMDFLRAVRDLRRPRFDVVLDLQGLTKSGMWSRLTGSPKRLGFAGKESREINRYFMTQTVNASAGKSNIIEINLEMLTALGISSDQFSRKAVIAPSSCDCDYVTQWASAGGHDENKGKFLVIDPFAGWETKTWAWENWMELSRLAAERFGLMPLITWGPGEEEEALHLREEIFKYCEGHVRPVVSPKTTLLQLAELLRRFGACMVAGDTGPMHIAAAVGVPVVVIFGPSCSVRNAPAFEGARFEILHDTSQPCAGTYDRVCRHGHSAGGCMGTVTPSMVLEALVKILD